MLLRLFVLGFSVADLVGAVHVLGACPKVSFPPLVCLPYAMPAPKVQEV